MYAYRSLDLMRAENLLCRNRSLKGDYPIRLLTRRTFALSAGAILGARRTAPGGIRFGDPRRAVRRPPC